MGKDRTRYIDSGFREKAGFFDARTQPVRVLIPGGGARAMQMERAVNQTKSFSFVRRSIDSIDMIVI